MNNDAKLAVFWFLQGEGTLDSNVLPNDANNKAFFLANLYTVPLPTFLDAEQLRHEFLLRTTSWHKLKSVSYVFYNLMILSLKKKKKLYTGGLRIESFRLVSIEYHK